MERVSLRRGSLHALRWPGEGAPVVILHGLFDSAYSWRAFAERSSRPLLALDLPGFGMSPPISEATLEDYASLLADALGDHSPYHLLGHSMGGGIASYLANQESENVLSLALLAPAGFGWSWRIAAGERLRKIFAFSRGRFAEEKTIDELSYAYFVTHNKEPKEEDLDRLLYLAENRQRGIEIGLRALASANHRNRLQKDFYWGPTLAIWGARDNRISPRHRHHLSALLPQAQIEIWPGCGHHPQREEEGRLLYRLEKFWKGLPR
jgi:pimeloyl-ACP methyl ester carboxylesterase